MTTDRRLIEVAFPLRQASLDSVHEKNIRHGHISTLHIWPARRPLAAARACIAATLLPAPESAEEQRELIAQIGGEIKVVQKKNKRGQLKEREVTEGGILHWGQEASAEFDEVRARIHAAHGGRAPRVLDPFSGGGAIPLEAMRLGCEALAADLNPVAWFLLRCTLEYPQRLAGQELPIPEFAWNEESFRASWFKGPGKSSKRSAGRRGQKKGTQQAMFGQEKRPSADLSWHLRAWGQWVHARVAEELAAFYPVYVELRAPRQKEALAWEAVPPGTDPEEHARAKNAELFDGGEPGVDSPMWVVVPTMAYLWARTGPCKKCGADLPLLKTRWLSKKENTRAVLTMATVDDGAAPGGKRVVFGVRMHLPVPKGNRNQKIAKDKEVGKGTMNRAGAVCPCCDAPMSMDDIRLRGVDGQLGQRMTSVVVSGAKGKEFRLPRIEETDACANSAIALSSTFADVHLGMPTEPTPKAGQGASRAFSVDGYGLDSWDKLFTTRQLVALGTFLKAIRSSASEMTGLGYPSNWIEAIYAYLCVRFNRLLDRCSTICRPDPSPTQSGIMNTFARFALPMTWDFIEGNTLAEGSGGWLGDTDWVSLVVERNLGMTNAESPEIARRSAIEVVSSEREALDAVITDPPYYDAIPYSDLMDFFYVWMRRLLVDSPIDTQGHFDTPLAPKWDADANDGELVEDASRFEGDCDVARATYEDGMFRSFQAMWRALKPDGRLVVVFANKQPDAWEALVSALIRAGFQVTGSWPIQTERQARTRSLGSAALSSSVWLVCRKRPRSARPGFDTTVLDEMRANIGDRLRLFWDQGIRGPDFVWAATGPALEAYSQHPFVKKADAQGEALGVNEFLAQARRMVVEFVVGRVLAQSGEASAASLLDPVTSYWLLHRQSFGTAEVPIGPVILYAVSCGLSDSDLVDAWDLLQIKGHTSAEDDEEDEDNENSEEDEDSDDGGGIDDDKRIKVTLKPWHRRTGKGLGESAPGGRAVPVIDKVHRCMHLWKKGELSDLDRYIASHALIRDIAFHQVLQAAIELSERGSGERELLEALSNHLGVGATTSDKQEPMPYSVKS